MAFFNLQDPEKNAYLVLSGKIKEFLVSEISFILKTSSNIYTQADLYCMSVYTDERLCFSLTGL